MSRNGPYEKGQGKKRDGLSEPNGSIKVHPGRQHLQPHSLHIIAETLANAGNEQQVFTSGTVRDHSDGEVDLSGVQVWRGADGVVARLQQGQLGQQQSGGHLDGRELLHHLHQGRVVEPLPLLVLLQALHWRKPRWDNSTGGYL